MSRRRSLPRVSHVLSCLACAKRPLRFSHSMSVGKLMSLGNTAVAYHAAYEDKRLNRGRVIKRPYSRQVIRSGRVPVSTCRWNQDFHCLNSRSICHRIRYTVSTTAAAQTAELPCVRYQPNCNQWRYAWVGGRPFFRAVSYALRRRCSMLSSARR